MKISIKTTNNPTILKFEADSFLTDHESFEFNNIDEAKASPLAQQLFYLPFVKKVYISGNFVAIERYNIVEWTDVQNDVAEQIENYLNDSGKVFNEQPAKKTAAVTVYAESTPNPSAMKFVTNKKLVTSIYDFTTIDEARNSPFATQLFHLPFVKGVFIDENFISITKYDVAEWEDITMELREFIRDYIQKEKEIIAEKTPEVLKRTSEQIENSYENLDDISKEIVSILEEYVKPAVARDGGNIQFESYNPESKTVKVILQGACSGCPSSTYTLKSGIENILKEMMKGKVELVEAVNG